MSVMTSQISGVFIICSTVVSGADQRKYRSSAALAFVRGIDRWPVKPPPKGPVTQKMFPSDDVIMRTLLIDTVYPKPIFCCVLCGVTLVDFEKYTSGLLHWHQRTYMANDNEATLANMGRSTKNYNRHNIPEAQQSRGPTSMYILCSLYSSLIPTLIARFMGPTWGLSGTDRTQVGPMRATWTSLSGLGVCGSDLKFIIFNCVERIESAIDFG